MPNRRPHSEKGIETILYVRRVRHHESQDEPGSSAFRRYREDQRDNHTFSNHTHRQSRSNSATHTQGSSRSYPNPPPPVVDYEAVTEETWGTRAYSVSPVYENDREHHPKPKSHENSAASNKNKHHTSSSKQKRDAKSKNHEHSASSNHHKSPKKHKHRSSSRKYEHNTSSNRAESSSEAKSPYWETKSGNFEMGSPEDPKPEPKDTPSPTPRNVPLPIQQALAKGENTVRSLGATIDVVLLHEWCMDGDDFHTLPEDFKSSCKVIPVKRDRFGKYQPIEDTKSEWGFKTEYDPKYSTYIASILIQIPLELSGVSKAQLNAAYNRFFVGPRNEKLVGVLAIPFKDHPDCRKYAMLFHFESGSRGPRLFDDYMLEDAVIKL